MKKIRDQMEHISCNLCGADNYTVIYKPKYNEQDEHDLVEKFRSSGDEILIDQVVKCKKCGLIYINPRLKANLIFKGYSLGEDPNFVSQAKGREQTFQKSLYLISKYTKKGKILDIGTAGGSFLHVAKRNGWKVYGLEPNIWLCKWCKKHYGINISSKSLLDQKYPSDFFDAVTLWDVLEHMPNPKETLEECHRILKSNGLLVVNYPDIGTWISKVMGSKWVFLLSIHLFYFTKKTMKEMLRIIGFKPFLIKPHFQRLSLGYLIFRMHAYSTFLHKVGKKTTDFLNLGHVQIPYWLGQTLVLARKK